MAVPHRPGAAGRIGVLHRARLSARDAAAAAGAAGRHGRRDRPPDPRGRAAVARVSRLRLGAVVPAAADAARHAVRRPAGNRRPGVAVGRRRALHAVAPGLARTPRRRSRRGGSRRAPHDRRRVLAGVSDGLAGRSDKPTASAARWFTPCAGLPPGPCSSAWRCSSPTVFSRHLASAPSRLRRLRSPWPCRSSCFATSRPTASSAS